MPLDKQQMFTEPRMIARSLGAISATSSFAIGVLSDTLKQRVERVELMVDADYADDSAAYYVFTLQAGSTVIATWSTQTGQEGALTALTPVKMTLSSTDANLVQAAGTALKMVATKHSTAANITPRTVVHGRTVS